MEAPSREHNQEEEVMMQRVRECIRAIEDRERQLVKTGFRSDPNGSGVIEEMALQQDPELGPFVDLVDALDNEVKEWKGDDKNRLEKLLPKLYHGSLTEIEEQEVADIVIRNGYNLPKFREIFAPTSRSEG